MAPEKGSGGGFLAEVGESMPLAFTCSMKWQ